MPNSSSQENNSSEPVYLVGSDDASISPGDRPSLKNFAEILEQILSFAEPGQNDIADPCQIDLIRIAARHSTLDFCLDPVLMDLIQVVTRRIKGLTPTRLAALERTVANSLIDDQISLMRLQRFWEHLKGLAAHGK